MAMIPGETARVDVHLLGKGGLSVVVRQANGDPAAGAMVSLRGGAYPNDELAGVTDTNGVYLVPSPALFAGRYAIDARLPSGPTTLMGRSAANVVIDQVTAVEVTLTPTANLRGVFLAADGVERIAFAQVTIGGLGFAATDANGEFSIEGLPLGTYAVTAVDPVNGMIARESVVLDEVDAWFDVLLREQETGRVFGTVIASSGDALVAAAPVTLTPLDGVSTARSVTTDPSGFFEFAGVPPGPFRLFARDPVTNVQGQNQAVLPAGATAFEVDVALQPLGTFTVRVFEPDGATPAEATVRLNGQLEIDTDAAGEAVFADQILGTQRVMAHDRRVGMDGRVVEGSFVISQPGVVAEPFELVLAGRGRVEGRVLEADLATAVPGAGVQLIVTDGLLAGRVLSTLADGQGDYAFDNVPEGPFRLVARHLGLAANDAGAVGGEGDLQTIDLVLGASGDLRGRIVDAEGEPLENADAVVTFMRQGGGTAIASARTDAEGRFEILDLPVGAFTFEGAAPFLLGRTIRPLPGEEDPILPSEGLDLGDVALDFDFPTVASITPAATSVDVPIDVTVVLEFDEPLDPGTIDDSGIYLQTGGTIVPASAELQADRRIVHLVPDAPLESEQQYQVVVVNGDLTNALGALIASGPRDLVGRALLQPFFASFTTADQRPPVLLSFTPNDGAIQVARESVVRLSFDEAVIEESVSATLFDGADQPVAASVSVGVGGQVLTLVPDLFLAPNARYRVVLDGARDAAGNLAEGQPYQSTFDTVDTFGPTITELRIQGGASPVAGAVIPIEAVLAEPEAQVSVRMSADLVVFGQSPPGSLVVPFPLPEDGRITIRAVAIDRFGNEGPLGPELVVDVVPNQPPSVAFARITPAGGPAETGSTVEVEVSASDDVSVTEIRAAAQGACSAPLTTSAGAPITVSCVVAADAGPDDAIEVLAEAIDGSGASSGEQTLAIAVADATPPTVAILSPGEEDEFAPGSSVEIQVEAADNFAVTELRLDVSGAIVDQQIQSVDPPAAETATSFGFGIPAELDAGETLVLTVTARDAAGAEASTSISIQTQDLVGPTLGELLPANAELDLPATPVVRARFDEPIDLASAFSGQLSLEDGAGNPIPTHLGLAESGATLTLRPRAPLVPGEIYTAFLTGGITDLAGNPLTEPDGTPFQDVATHFTIGDAAIVSPTDGSVLIEGEPVQIAADASRLPDTRSVTFFDAAADLGSDGVAPFVLDSAVPTIAALGGSSWTLGADANRGNLAPLGSVREAPGTSAFPRDPSLAIDGNRDGDFANGSVTH
ncbi:MAG: hypothetical protein HKP30_17515, partial [Myxococcales bacterium]|nr:hypothetical protein [Myxococcales bacterium]